MIATLSRFFDRVLLVLLWISAALLLAMTASIIYEVVARYFFNRPTRWVMDFSEYALFHIVLLGSAWSLSRGHFVRIDVLLHYLPPRSKCIALSISALVAAAICGLLTFHGLEMTWDAYQRSSIFQRGVLFPRWPVIAALPLGMAVLGIELIRQAIWQFVAATEMEDPRDAIH